MAVCGLEEAACDIVKCVLFGVGEASLRFRDLPSKPVRFVSHQLDENMALDTDLVIVAHSDGAAHEPEQFSRFLGDLKHSVIPTAALVFVLVCDSKTRMYDESEWAKIRAMFHGYTHLKSPQLLCETDPKSVDQIKAVVYSALDTHADPPEPTCPLCFFWQSIA